MKSTAFASKYALAFGVPLLLVAVTMLAGCSGGDAKKNKSDKSTPVPVAIKTVKPGTVDLYATYPGRIQGAREVEVRARVEGILIRRHYNEGEVVETGELLFTISPEPFKATVQQREAKLAQARANLNQAQEVWERVSHLFAINAVSEAERDEAYAKLQTAQAAVELAQANLEAAQIQLDYTSVEAPLGGVTSLEEVDVGARVTPGTLLTTITQLDPVHVRFAVPAEDAMMRQQALAAMVKDGEAANSAMRRQAFLIMPSGKRYEQAGFVDFTQSTIDPTTGTVRMRAVFDNSDHELVPGRFVQVRIRLETRHNTIVVPNKAIADSQTQTFVLVVTDDSKAKSVPVELGPTVEGGRIIESGLEAGDRVIVVGLGQVKPGDKVEIKPIEKVALDGQPFGKDGGKPDTSGKTDGAQASKTGSKPDPAPADSASGAAEQDR